VFTDRGYVHVVVARRGMGRSEGESVVFFNDADVDDHAKAIAWGGGAAVVRRETWVLFWDFLLWNNPSQM